jgi:antitoxin (DNA-binding transcriptional repressor) of toxin-antitoxin stability system
MTKTIAIQDVPSKWSELVALAMAGNEILLVEGSVPRLKLIALPYTGAKRVPGLHPGAMKTTDDFDEPLPDEFWCGSA